MGDATGIDPLYDLGPLPGGDILFRPDSSDVLPPVPPSTPTSIVDAGPPAPLDTAGPEAPERTEPVTPRPLRPLRSPAPSTSATGRRSLPPPQTYTPTPRPGPAPAPVDLRGGGPVRPGRATNPDRATSTPGASLTVALRWAVRHPRLAFGAAFLVVGLLTNLLTALSSGSDGGSPEASGTIDSGPFVVQAGDGEMSYYPQLVPGDVATWRIVVDNPTDLAVPYTIEDETTGEVLVSGTNEPNGTAIYDIPADRVDDRISVVQDAPSLAGLSGCHVLADDTEVGSSSSEAGLTCTYDPDSLRG